MYTKSLCAQLMFPNIFPPLPPRPSLVPATHCVKKMCLSYHNILTKVFGFGGSLEQTELENENELRINTLVFGSWICNGIRL
jgi:hypothetical protein